MKALQTILNLGVDVKLTQQQAEEIKQGVNLITGKHKTASNDNYRLRYENEKLKQRVKELESCVIKFRKGVTHFNRTRGDLNPLLTAYVECEQLRKEQDDASSTS